MELIGSLTLEEWAFIAAILGAVIGLLTFGGKLARSAVRVFRSALPTPKPTVVTRGVVDGLFGRVDDLTKIHETFKTSTKCVLIGPGGIGKTALARTFQKDAAETKTYDRIVFITAGEEGLNAEGYRGIATQFGIDAAVKDNALVEATYQAMNDSGQTWLVIIDNVDTEQLKRDLRGELYNAAGVHHLITSRLTGWENFGPIKLETLDDSSATMMLSELSERGAPNDVTLLHLATEVLQGLPLAIRVAAATLKSEKKLGSEEKLSVEEYAEQLDARLKSAPNSDDPYDKSVYVAVEESYNRLSDDAQALLRIAAYLNPEDIADDYIATGAAYIAAHRWEALPAPYDRLAEQTVVGPAINELRLHSLLEEGVIENAFTNRIHRLTQRAIRLLMGEEEKAIVIGLCGRLGRAQFTSNVQFSPQDWPRYRRLAPHADILLDEAHLAKGEDAKRAGGFINESALFYYVGIGDLRRAMRLYDANVAVMIAAYGKDTDEHAAALSNLAEVQDGVSRASKDEDEKAELDQQAQLNFEDAIAIREKSPALTLKMAYTLNNLAAFYWARKRFTDAEIEYLRAKDIVERHGAALELRGSAHGNLGQLYSDWADATVNDAEALAERREKALYHKNEGLKLTEKGVGPRHLVTATRVYNLAIEYEKIGQPSLAQPLYQRAAGIVVAMAKAGMIDDTHPEFQRMFGSFVKLLHRQDPTLTAEQAAEKALRLAVEEAERVHADHAAWEQQRAENKKDED
ncbi:NB-ARC domain-containing protein [Parvularcula marina]|uniref:NB-ARC domain-containing protein n=1 Tax=Parvularcula marina TaxID=2292771 RepID=UPI003515AD22